MSKTKPIGVRFDEDLLEVLKEDEKCETPQQCLNFLSAFWNENRPNKIDFAEKFKHFVFNKTGKDKQTSNKSPENKKANSNAKKEVLPPKSPETMPEGLDWKEQLNWRRNHKK